MTSGELVVMQPPVGQRRSSMWAYYERRVAYREAGAHNVLNYFRGLGVNADLNDIDDELRHVHLRLSQLPPTAFLDVGVGPVGTFTLSLPGRGIALDQSDAAVRRFRAVATNVPVLRADATLLPIASKAVGRVFMSHVYGLLLPEERFSLLTEASRVGREIVVLDSGRPAGAQAEEWQTRTLPDGTTYPIYRRHFDIQTLLRELGGEVLFDGNYFVMVRAATGG
jgi:hypothetical protein